jgi:hypothetical protein
MAVQFKSSEAQQNFGRIIDQALIEGDIIIERYGEPLVVMVGYNRYQELIQAERSLSDIYLTQPIRTPEAKDLGQYMAKKVREELSSLDGSLEDTMTSLRGRS